MVTIEKALDIIYSEVTQKSKHILPIEDSLGAITAREYKAQFDLPRFDNSAMDGFAVKLANSGDEVKIRDAIYAGDRASQELKLGEQLRL